MSSSLPFLPPRGVTVSVGVSVARCQPSVCHGPSLLDGSVRSKMKMKAEELVAAPPTLTLLIVFFTTTSDSCTSVDFSARAEAEANTLSLDLNWLRVDSASPM